ncbi:DUF4345 domain-containing protein [Kitasatospora phosalacinea]|uniref:DUF4345 domain-containing protein n=1 Tax=Kitasatospora phosalacinea TaxID=2065 RepID=A0A9W6UQN0_9ACTN|nr:DUF4345 domain-containing protein [Kitasatospora phosalacinea]GLW57344.1 hypothetical protein Kpho01_53550 [Kitasatospora phosalacinea]
MARALRFLCHTMGWACLAIGLFHMLAGNAAVPGATDAGPTLDSLNRFFGAVFAGYGLAWLRTARRSPIPPAPVRILAGVLLLGGLSRLLSLAAAGRPHWFQLVLLAIELALPPVYFMLATADARATEARAAQARFPEAANG